MVDSYDLSLTKRVFETRSKTTANKKLYTGWILIGISQTEKGFIYALALPGIVKHRDAEKAKFDAKYPDGLDLLA